MAHFMTEAISPFRTHAASRTHTLSLSLRYLALFPSISDLYKMLSDYFMLIIE
jgi:hypothetical protein